MGAEDKDKLEGHEGQQDDPKTGEGDGSGGDGGKADDPKASDTEGASGSDGDDVKDSHGQPGINKERHDKEVAELKKEIASLKAEAFDYQSDCHCSKTQARIFAPPYSLTTRQIATAPKPPV